MTVADQMAFEALPVDVQDLARRVLGAAQTANAVDLPMVEKAYEQGWEDCNAEWQDNSPWLDHHDKANAAREIIGLPPVSRQKKVAA